MTGSLLLTKRKKKGFTLIELIVVIAILAIIALIAIPKVMGYQDNAKKKADVANAKSIANAVSAEITNGDISTGTAQTVDVVASTATAATSTPATSAADIQYYITKNMQSVPKQQSQNSGTDFFVHIDTDGSVHVLNKDTGGVEVYPNTNSAYTN